MAVGVLFCGVAKDNISLNVATVRVKGYFSLYSKVQLCHLN